ncbi:hypothetical protein ABZX85_48495 [Streptomyces sp. NPDC004539]|uniref:hypothetical protein n=1 Tax=Streptomyces sp. NPDC004539 TaxID=3154280 RepID=UPI0033A74EF3
MCFYAPEQSLATVTAFAEERGWRAGPRYTDDETWRTCVARPGWGLVRQQVRSGRAEGVVVLSDLDAGAVRCDFMEQLAWFGTHLAFVAVVEVGRR